MVFSKALSLSTVGLLGLSGVLAVPARRQFNKPVNGDSTTPSGPVPGSAIKDLQDFVAFAGAAYGAPSDIQSWSCTECQQVSALQNIQVFQDTNNNLEQAYIGVDSNRQTIVVSFRGTIRTLEDWLNDLDITLVNDNYLSDGALICQGFQTAYDTVRSGIQEALPNYVNQFPGFTITFMGHSLGGAVATLAAADAAKNFLTSFSASNMYLVTFGSPRVGNPSFASFFNSIGLGDIWRSANFADIVGQVPPAALGYEHVAVSSVGLDEGSNPPDAQFCGGDPSSECDFTGTVEPATQHLNYYDRAL
ncbi:Alpha/Beta hydrolase protein [Blyttiomyces helicus]|uniref:Alpha/Beta hydrolase protein n=1 Tax=Blyttiomyces helicus TaxID=388810 RepID=A0A4P9WFY9_9FUNG|nr:Alpha/Beta hydrolase protein [Blyttiomyces helicus]|eukprot:RKO91252.1 Alpha/Beta hydrolase protein [Blyttiomyces helicus]